MTHYMAAFYSEDGALIRDDQITAYDDSEAIREAKNAAIWIKPAFFKLRIVKRIGYTTIYDSTKDAK
jgi:hypothetical protein